MDKVLPYQFLAKQVDVGWICRSLSCTKHLMHRPTRSSLSQIPILQLNQSLVLGSPNCGGVEPPESTDIKRAASEIMASAVRQTEERVAEVRRRAEDAVNQVSFKLVTNLGVRVFNINYCCKPDTCAIAKLYSTHTLIKKNPKPIHQHIIIKKRDKNMH